jgi:TetR/AcrR family transcriptional repressor of nem operon
MARPREFDEAAVLDAAIQCFWSRGYDATSMRDLVDQTGLTNASLYNAFGDKRSLYGQALVRYVERGLGERLGRFETQLTPRAAIGAFFEDVIERSLKDRQRKGCMVVNAAVEVAPHDAEFQSVVAGVLNRLEAFFRRCVVAGQQAGTITPAQSADDLARLLLSVLLGMRVLARVRPERDLLQGVIRPVFALLDSHQANTTLEQLQ